MKPEYPSSTPPWFLTAVAQDVSEHVVQSEAVPIHYRCWNVTEQQKPALLFVHGYRGHSHWWDFVAPSLREHFRVFAMDLSGMGDSGHRSTYTSTSHLNDIATVINAIGVRTTMVAHSYGGICALRVCAEQPHLIEHAIILDSLVLFPDDAVIKDVPRVGRPTPYIDYESARARFRLMPAQSTDAYALEHIAYHSLRAVDGGWTWKFDVRLPHGIPEPGSSEVLARIRAPVDIVIGAKSSVVSFQGAQRIVACLSNGRGPVVVPEAGHHLMLDQPLATIAVLRALLAPDSMDL